MMKKTSLYLFLFAILLFALIPKFNSFFGSESKGKKFETVILDAGHGGKDPGTTGISGVIEKNINLPIVLKIRDYLKRDYDDLKVVLTRDKDEFPDLISRGKIANANEGNLFVSVHCNARKNEENDKNGFEVYILDLSRSKEASKITLQENKLINLPEVDSVNPEFLKNYVISEITQNANQRGSELFAEIVESELSKGTKNESRGVFQQGFWVLVSASMPTVLIETGYLSNKNDEKYLNSEKGQDDIAKAIYKAIRYYKMDYDFENSYK